MMLAVEVGIGSSLHSTHTRHRREEVGAASTLVSLSPPADDLRVHAMSTEDSTAWDGQYFRCPQCGCGYRLQASGDQPDRVVEHEGVVQCRYCDKWASLNESLVRDPD